MLRRTQTLVAASATIHIRIAPPPPRCRCSAHADDNLHGSSRLILMRADGCDTCRVSYMGRMHHSPCSRYRLHTPSFAIATFTALGLYIILCIARWAAGTLLYKHTYNYSPVDALRSTCVRTRTLRCPTHERRARTAEGRTAIRPRAVCSLEGQ